MRAKFLSNITWKHSEIFTFKDKADGLNLLHEKTKECEEVFLNSVTQILQFCDSDPPILWRYSSKSLTLILQFDDSNLAIPRLCSCQVEKFVAKVKAEKERARKALEMEARREQGAVSLNFT